MSTSKVTKLKHENQEKSSFLKLVLRKLIIKGLQFDISKFPAKSKEDVQGLNAVLTKEPYKLSKRAAHALLYGGNIKGPSTYKLLDELNLLRNPEAKMNYDWLNNYDESIPALEIFFRAFKKNQFKSAYTAWEEVLEQIKQYAQNLDQHRAESKPPPKKAKAK